MPPSRPRVAFLLNGLDAGGAERVACSLVEGLSGRGVAAEVLAWRTEGPLKPLLSPDVPLIETPPGRGVLPWLAMLRASSATLRPLLRVLLHGKGLKRLALPPRLIARLRHDPPAALCATTPSTNLQAVLAARLTGAPTRVVVSEHSVPSTRWDAARTRRMAPLLRAAYGLADTVVAVSNGVADDLAATTGLPRRRITVVYNPVVPPDFEAKAALTPDDPWFQTGEPPVVLSVGRLHPVKDPDTLLRAFARLQGEPAPRLVMMGPGDAGALAARAGDLGFGERFRHLGFRANPWPYMKRAAVFALSSRSEAFGNVLVEALACGTPVVSTDCPHGPAEILEGGRYGRLVPVADDAALGAAIEASLASPPTPGPLKARAAAFDYARTLDAYQALLLRP